MSGSNEGHDVMDDTDGEAEEMEQDSGESDKSSTHTDSSGGSDSDESSDMDEEEWERRRNECIQDLSDLERQFNLVKEQLYRERIAQVDLKLKEVQAGKAVEYLQPLDELSNNKATRIEVAKVLKKLKITSIKRQFEAEEMAAEQNFINEQNLALDALREDIEEKIRRLEEDRNNADFSPDYLYECSSGKRSRKRAADPLNPERKKKPVTVAGPYIVYMLQEEDILEDWAIVKKAITLSNRIDYGTDTAPTNSTKKVLETKSSKSPSSKHSY